MKRVEKEEWRVHGWVGLGSAQDGWESIRWENADRGIFCYKKEFAGEQVQNKEGVRSLHSFQNLFGIW